MTNTTKSSTEQQGYFSYLLRLWRVTESGAPLRKGKGVIWRASLQSSRTGDELGFASLDDLFDFLRRHTAAVSDTDQDEGGAKA